MINPAYKHYSMTHLARHIVATDGAAALWRGLTPALLRITVGSSLYFTIQTQLLHTIQQYQHRHNTAHDTANNAVIDKTKYLLVGAVSRGCAVALACPISVVKTRYEGQRTKQYTSVLNALTTISRTEGVRGLYAGLLPSVIKDAPYAAVYLYMYTSFKSLLHNTLDSTAGHGVHSYHNILIQFTSGFTAGAVATTLFHPFEVVKTRRQLQHTARHGTLAMMQHVYQHDGLRGLYRGLLPRVLRRSVSNAMSWMLFEQIVAFYKGFTGL